MIGITRPTSIGRDGGWEKTCKCIKCGWESRLKDWKESPGFFSCRKCKWMLSKDGTWFWNKMYEYVREPD